MIQPGIFHVCKVLRIVAPGAILEVGEGEEILLPGSQMPPDIKVDEMIRVFIYTDSEDRPIATTMTPFLKASEFGWLKIKQVGQFGAFADIGLTKDLLIPFRQMKSPLSVGQMAPVYMYVDAKTSRLAGSTKCDKYLLPATTDDLELAEEVEVLIIESSGLGFKSIINNRFRGILYRNETMASVMPGDRLAAYVKNIREDGAVDLTLRRPGYDEISHASIKLLELIKINDGFLALSDKSSPAAIVAALAMSKRTFKAALGALLKEKKVKTDNSGIYLIEK